MAAQVAPAADVPALIDGDSLAFLRKMAAATIDAARVRPGKGKPGAGANTTGINLITPGGNYPAFWVRDYAMSLDCGLIGADEMLPQLRLIAHCQNGPDERRLKSGGIIPPFAIPDHITLGGGAVFYPGTYSTGEEQGANPWGPLPPADDHYYFVHIAHALWRASGDAAFLNEMVDGMSIADRLCQAFAAPPADPATGASIATPGRRAVGFGFQDTVYLQGAMCFATLLRWQAARELSALCAAGRRPGLAQLYRDVATRIAAGILPLFADPQQIAGWLRGATEVGRQPDVWATLYALHLGILPKDAAARARQTVVTAVKSPKTPHSIEYQGAVRHVPVEFDFSAKSAWERCVAPRDTYQNGAYWHVPTGWLAEAILPVDPELARQVIGRFMAHLRQNDFRKGPGHGAPWECFAIDLRHAQNPVYMASVTVPLGVLKEKAR